MAGYCISSFPPKSLSSNAHWQRTPASFKFLSIPDVDVLAFRVHEGSGQSLNAPSCARAVLYISHPNRNYL
jgi:hypothetical protein